MSRNYGTLVLLVLAIFAERTHSFDLSLGDITEVLHFAREAVEGGLQTFEIIRKSNPEDAEYDFPFIKKMERRLMNQISMTAKKIDVYQEKMELKSEEALDKILTTLPINNKLDRSFHEMTSILTRVDDLFKDAVAYNSSAQYQRLTKEEFAKISISSLPGALPDLLQKLHRLVVPGQYDNYDNSLLVLLAQSTKVRNSILRSCSRKKCRQIFCSFNENFQTPFHLPREI